MTAAVLASTIEHFIQNTPEAVVVESGDVLFELKEANYSLNTQYDRCVVQFWSSERNCVRRVLEAEEKRDALHLTTNRLGQLKPGILKICRDPHHKVRTEKQDVRASYDLRLGRALERHLPGCRVAKIKSTFDLEHSFGPAYARGLLRKGRQLYAIVGVNRRETAATLDGALTVGLLWLDHLRNREAGNNWVAGLKLVVPPRRSGLLRERLRYIDQSTAPCELFEFDEHNDTIDKVELRTDLFNPMLSSQLVHCPNRQEAEKRFASSITKVRQLCPDCDYVVVSPSELSFRVHGLEFAIARMANTIHAVQEVLFTHGGGETALTDATVSQFQELSQALQLTRRVGPPKANERLWRTKPTSWLESTVLRDASKLNLALDQNHLYPHVPPIATGRPLADLLSVDSRGRVAVLALTAVEDMHFPLQALDCWASAAAHHRRGMFPYFGYFTDRELQPQEPLLYLVAPIFRIHPTTEALLRYISPSINWELVAINENWRNGLKVMSRKRSGPRTQSSMHPLM